jgi:branched-chain amino acid transport system permease protein
VTLLNQWLQDWLPRLFGHAGNFEIIVFGMLLLILHRAREGMWPALLRLLRVKASPRWWSTAPPRCRAARCRPAAR